MYSYVALQYCYTFWLHCTFEESTQHVHMYGVMPVTVYTHMKSFLLSLNLTIFIKADE